MLVSWGDSVASCLQTLWSSCTILWCIPIWLMLYWHGDDQDVLILLRLSVLLGEHANYSQIIKKILTIHSIYDYFPLLKTFNANTLNVHRYFKDKLFSYQQSHMYNTKYRTSSNIYSTFYTFKYWKIVLHQVIPMWNSLYQVRLKIALPGLHWKKKS